MLVAAYIKSINEYGSINFIPVDQSEVNAIKAKMKITLCYFFSITFILSSLVNSSIVNQADGVSSNVSLLMHVWFI